MIHRTIRHRSPLTAIFALFALAGVMLFLGAATGCRTGAPTAIESDWFNVQTNQVPVVTLMTNEVLSPVSGEFESVVTPITNVVEEYVFSPGDRVQAVSETAQSVGNSLMPGAGSLAGLIVTGLGWLYASVRSRSKGKALAAVIQGLETARAVLKQAPQGQELDAKLVKWLIRHQAEAGVLKDVSVLVQRTVDNEDAQAVAKAISEFLAERTDQQAPVEASSAAVA